ncbi:MAG: ParB N-terminal domain-containing protein [Spirochaetes bacterium]|nr:ParB N-terminal domain-containing protein [Spirochaetota bacterium]
MKELFQESSVLLRDINFNDATYKISKPKISEELIQSIRSYGILEKPTLIRSENEFIILFGHNRLLAAQILEQTHQACVILKSFDLEYFFRYALLKLYRLEVGPLGKIKLFQILKKYKSKLSFCFEEFAWKELGIPPYLASSEELMKKALALPRSLAEFLEIKDPGYKTIRDLLLLSDSSLSTISEWVEMIPFRVNVFRQIIDIVYDIERMGKNHLLVNQTHIPLDAEGRNKEVSLLEQLTAIRYPIYWDKKNKALTISEQLKKIGIAVKIPEFFEGNEIVLSFRLDKKQGIEEIKSKIDRINPLVIEELLSLL